MTKVAIDSIVVEERQRGPLTDIDKLASSIARYGLLHPIVVDRSLRLIAGQRRLTACKTLKQEDIDVTFRDELSALQRKELELEENIQRVDIPWDRQVRARYEIDQLKKELYGEKFYGREEGWTIADTAISLKESESLVRKDIMLAKAMEVMPELSKCKNKNEAFNLLKREKGAIRRAEASREIEKRLKENPSEELIQIIMGDCVSVISGMSTSSIDLCIADPPFGVGLDSISDAVGAKYLKYEDPKERHFELYKEVIPQIYRVLKPNSHLYLFFPIGENYPFYLNCLRSSFNQPGDYVDAIPLVWIKSTGGGTVNAYDRYQPRYQPLFFCKKGAGRKLKTGTPNGNVLDFRSVPIGRREHPAEAPIELFEFLIDQSSLPGECILDPFGGSGASADAMRRLKRRGVVIEKEERYVEMIRARVYGEKERG